MQTGIGGAQQATAEHFQDLELRSRLPVCGQKVGRE
jgi:hypothetical protein